MADDGKLYLHQRGPSFLCLHASPSLTLLLVLAFASFTFILANQTAPSQSCQKQNIQEAMVLLESVLTIAKGSKSSLKIIPRPKRIEDLYSNPKSYMNVDNSNIHISQEVCKCLSMDE